MSINFSFSGSLNKKKIPLFVPYNGKIADITHADTGKHTLTLANAAGTGAIAGERRKIIGAILLGNRQAGTGEFYIYPNEGSSYLHCTWALYGKLIIIADGTQRVQYSLTVAGDDFDFYCYGYVVEA